MIFLIYYKIIYIYMGKNISRKRVKNTIRQNKTKKERELKGEVMNGN